MVRAVTIFLLLSNVVRASDCPPSPGGRDQVAARLQQLGEAAQQAFGRGDYERASDLFRQSVCLAPTAGSLYQGLGLAEAASGQFDLAEKSLLQSDKLSPDDFGTIVSLAQVEALSGHLDAATATLARAQKLNPASSTSGQVSLAQVHIQIGSALLQQKRFDLALAQFLRARQNGRRDPEILLTLATLENNLGAYTDAILDSRSVVSTESATAQQRSTAATIAGLAYKNDKKYEDAIRLLKSSVEFQPNEIAYLTLAETCVMNNQVQEAVHVLDGAASAMPDSLQIQGELGRRLVEAGDNKRAVEVLGALIQRSPNQVEAWHWIAQAHSLLGNYKDSATALEQVAKLQPSFPMIDVMVAQALLKVESPDYEQVLHVLDRGAEATPTDPDVFYLRGKAYFALGRYEEAVKALQKSIELSPTVSLTYYLLGRTLQRLGREDEAKHQFEKVRYLKEQGR